MGGNGAPLKGENKSIWNIFYAPLRTDATDNTLGD